MADGHKGWGLRRWVWIMVVCASLAVAWSSFRSRDESGFLLSLSKRDTAPFADTDGLNPGAAH